MKKNAVVINTSRGGTINEAELIESLDNGVIAGACLDVFESEPRPNAALLKHSKIITTPHIGAATAEAQERIGLEIAENVKRIMDAN
jgi:D-3-phosphoglycerate dehydrogenase